MSSRCSRVHPGSFGPDLNPDLNTLPSSFQQQRFNLSEPLCQKQVRGSLRTEVLTNAKNIQMSTHRAKPQSKTLDWSKPLRGFTLFHYTCEATPSIKVFKERVIPAVTQPSVHMTALNLPSPLRPEKPRAFKSETSRPSQNRPKLRTKLSLTVPQARPQPQH